MVEQVPSNSERCVPMLRRNHPEMYDAGTFSSPRSADERSTHDSVSAAEVD